MTILCSAATVAVAIPLIRRTEANPENISPELAVYQDQITELDRDLLNGTVNLPEADTARREIQRRLTAAEKTPVKSRPVSAGWRNFSLLMVVAVLIVGSVGLYGLLGSPDMRSEPQPPPAAIAEIKGTVAELPAMVLKLKARLQQTPNDPEGWRMLGWAQMNLQHFNEAAEAYFKAMGLDPANTEYKSAFVDATVQSAQGIVTPQASKLISEVLEKQPQDSRARFYDALAHEQGGDQSGALDRWVSLLRDTPVDAGWRDHVRQRITELGKILNRDVTASLAATVTPPTFNDQSSTSTESNAMIAGMVARLAEKLVTDPNNLEGWIQLMRAYRVLNEPAKSKQAMVDALKVFVLEPVNLEKIKAAAAGMGIN